MAGNEERRMKSQRERKNGKGKRGLELIGIREVNSNLGRQLGQNW